MSALRIVEKIVSRNVALPILNTILLKAENGQLKLSATNLEVGVNYWLGAKVEKEGEMAVPARIFTDFISNVSDEKVSLVVAKNIISIDSEHYKTQILGMSTSDFPIIPKVIKDACFRVSSQILKTALLGVIDSAALSEIRPELSGVYVNIFQNQAEFAATDSFRLAEKIINIKNGKNRSFIIPRNTAIEVIRIAESIEGEVAISSSENQFFMYGEDFELISRLVDGRYPEYKRFIPDKFVSLAKVNRTELEKNIRLASIFSSSISDVKIQAAKDSMEISAKNSDRGEIVSAMACELKSKPFEVSVNYHYLLDGLKVIPSESVIFEFTGDGSPLVLKAEDRNDQTYLIMPLRN